MTNPFPALRVSEAAPSTCPQTLKIRAPHASSKAGKRGLAWRRKAVCLGILLAGGCVAHAQRLMPSWFQQSPANSPATRGNQVMVYDAAHGQVVMFGGRSISDTWLWDGTTWTQANPVNSPPPRVAAAMAYDAARGQIVLFGGLPPNSASGRLGDTWLWDGTNWTQANFTGGGPSARDGAAMVYDPVHGQTVLFGGIDASGTTLNDTWLWDGTAWTMAHPQIRPSARFADAMAFDVATGQVLMFGGVDSAALNETWIWDGITWAQLNPTTSPAPREDMGLVYSAALGQMVLFGGSSNNHGTYFNDTWLWSGTNWFPYSSATGPSPREFNEDMVYDAARDQVMFFGGLNFTQTPNSSSETWEFGLPGNFGNVNVCPSGQTTPAPCNNIVTFTYQFANGATLSTPQVTTQGVALLDYTLSSTTCVGTVDPGSCTVDVIFAPSAPGLRTGAIQLRDTSGNLLVSTLLNGVGQGPASAIGPGIQTALPLAGLHYNVGVAVDAAGNTFVADYAAQKVVKLTPAGVQTTVPASGVTAPIGVAEDGAGNLYIVDLNLSYVVKVAPSGAQTTLGSGLSHPIGIALDATGDVFVGDQNNNRVVKITPGGAQTVVPFTGLNQPWGVAVDAAGDVFVADGGNARVVQISPSGIQTTLPATGLQQPYGVAVDAAGDVYVADPVNARVVAVQAGSGLQTTVGSGLNYPSGLAVDGTGNIFIGDQGAGQVFEVNRSQPPSITFAATNLGSTSSDSPQSVMLQNIGNQPLNAVSPGFLVLSGPDFANVPGPGTPADCSASTGLASGGSCNLSFSFTPQSVGNSLTGTAVFNDNALNAIATSQTILLNGVGVSSTFQLTVGGTGSGTGTLVDSLGQISCAKANVGAGVGACTSFYPGGTQVLLTATATGTSKFLGWGGACSSAGTSPTCTVLINAATIANAVFVDQNAGSVNVCTTPGYPGQCSTGVPVTFVLPTTTTIGAIQVVTQGITGLDFTLSSGSSCAGTVVGGAPCTVNVRFGPIAPGLRMGAVQMFDSNGNLVASTPIYGVGLDPQVAFDPGFQSTLAANIPGLEGVAVDAAGNVFIAGGSGAIRQTPSGVQTPLVVSGTSPGGFYDVALDGAGNVYLPDSSNNRIVVLTPGGVQTTLPTIGLSFPTGAAVDGSGNVFITDRDNNRVVKVTAAGVQTTVPTTGLVRPYFPAIDAAGDVFFLDNGSQRVLKVTPDGVQSTVPFSGLIAGNGLAVDAAGDVFVSDQVLGVIFEITPSGTQTTLATNGLHVAAGLAVDAAGNVYNADNALGRVVKVTRSQPPAISFATTNVGSTSTDSPVTFTLQNVGNQPLTGSVAYNLGAGFTQNAATDCSVNLPLAPGGICGESFSFTPQSASFFSGTATFTTNTLNLFPNAVQTVAIQGTGAINGIPATVSVPNVVGQAQTAVATPLTAAGLATGNVTSASSSTVVAGNVISQSPGAGTQVAVGSVVNLLVSSGIAQPPSPNPLLLENNYFVTGDYVSAGVTLRGLGVGGRATRNIIIPSYAQSASQGVPDGSDVVDAFLYWESLENTATATSTSGIFNGYPVLGQQIGNDIPSYIDGAFTGTLRAYRASVNAYLPVGANGVRIVSGAYAVSLPDSGGTALPLTEGASLVMIYRVLSPNFPLKSIVLYDGSALPAAPAVQVMKGFYDAVGGSGGTGKTTSISASASGWSNSFGTVTLGAASQYTAPLNAANAYAAVILSTPVNNSDNDGILDAWKAGPAAGDFHAGQPGYNDVKTGTWVGLPGAKHGQKDLFVQLDYMCGAVLANGACDTTKENLFPAPDASGNDPLAMVRKAFAASGVQLHLQIGNAVPEDTCVDDLTTTPATLCQFPGQPGVIGWKNSLEFSKLWPRNLAACINGGDCTTRFPYGQKDSYHYVLFGHSLAIPAWNTRYGTLTSIKVASGITTITTVDRGTGINACPARITLGGVLGNPALNGVYNTTGCADAKTIALATPGVPDWSYPNTTLAEPVIGLTSGTISSISGYSDLGGADSAVTLGLWLTAPNQDMSKKANVVAGTLFHEIGHTLGLSHGGLYYDTPGSYVATFEANCKPNYQSVMNYLFQLDLVGPNQTIAFSNQTLATLNESSAGSIKQLTDLSNVAATFPTSAWYVPYTTGSAATPATRHCDGTPLKGDAAYRIDASIAPITPPWTNGQDLNFIGIPQVQERGFNDLTNMDLRQIGATGGEFASLASVLSFGASAAPLNISAGGTVALGSGGTVALGSGGTVALGSGGTVTLGSGGTVTLGSGGTVTLGSGGTVTLGSGGTVSPGSSGTVALGSGGVVVLSTGGTVALGSGGTVALGSGGTVTLGSGGTIALGSGGIVTIPASGGSYTIDGSGGTVTLGSGGTVALGSGGTVTLGSGGTVALGSGGTVTLGSGGTVTLGSGGTVTLGSGGTVALGSGGTVTLGSGGTVALGSGGTVTLGSGGTVTLGSGGTVTLGSGGSTTSGAGGTVTLGSGGSVTLGAGGTVTLGSGGTVTLGSGGTVTLGSGGTVALGSGGTVALGSGGTVTLGSGGTVTLGSGGTVTLGSGGTVTLGSGGAPISIGAGGTYTFGSSGGTVTLGSGGTVALGSGGTITLGSGGTVALGSGGTVTLGSGGTVTLGSGGTVTLGSGGTVTLGSGGVVALGNGGSVNLGSGSSSMSLGSVSSPTTGSGGPITDELTYETANSVVRPPTSPIETSTPTGIRITWQAPAFGVVSTYTIYRSGNGAAAIVIGSVSGVNGFPPATEFTDTNPDLVSQTVVYTIATTLVPDTTGGTQRQSLPSVPAVLKNDQSIALGPLPSSVTITNPPTITATALSGGVPNGLQVLFTATGSCAIGSQTLANKVSSAAIVLSNTGSCTVTASQLGTDAFNAANVVSGTFQVLPIGSGTQSQTLQFVTLPNVQYGGSFALAATSTSGLTVSFAASGHCLTDGSISGVGVCTITASAPANGTYSAASLTQSFNIYPAVLKVTATNLTSAFGQALPPLTAGYSGFVHGDSASVVLGAPALSTTATSTSSVGVYPITVATGTLATANYSFLYVNGTLTVQQLSQALLVLQAASPLTYGQSEILSVTGGTTGGVVTYNLVSGLCSVAGARLTAKSGNAVCQVTATMAGSTNYKAVTSAVSTVALSPASQGITFTTNPPSSAAFGTSFTVAATGGPSAIPVTFTSAGACTHSAAVYTMTASTGTCSVIASQAGNANYAAAPPITRTVTASGAPRLIVSPSSIDFGTVYPGSITARGVTVTNTGTAPALITDPILSIVRGGNSKQFLALNFCPKPLAAGKSCTIAVAFLAGPFFAPQTATLQIMSNAPGSPQPVTLSALVIDPRRAFSPSSLGFGTVKHATSSTMNVTLSNPGRTPLSIVRIAVAGANATSFVQTNTCGTSLAAGARCTIAVRFTPLVKGTFNADLTVVDNARGGDGCAESVHLLGKGD